MKYLLLLFSITFHGQILHHQMLSSQGTTKKTPGGLLVKQTVGQITSTGNYDGDSMIVGQGFQQSSWERLIISNKVDVMDVVKVYPNPFVSIINFEFSKPITDLISITIFDENGRLVFEKKKDVVNAVLTLDLSILPRSIYLVRLNSPKFNYYFKIMKQL
jgi:hypothetical protein